MSSAWNLKLRLKKYEGKWKYFCDWHVFKPPVESFLHCDEYMCLLFCFRLEIYAINRLSCLRLVKERWWEILRRKSAFDVSVKQENFQNFTSSLKVEPLFIWFSEVENYFFLGFLSFQTDSAKRRKHNVLYFHDRLSCVLIDTSIQLWFYCS